MRGLTLALVMTAALGCNEGGANGVEACENYVDANDACNQAYADANPDGFAFDNQLECAGADVLGASYYQCLADAVNAADCTDEDAYLGLNDAIIDCAE